MLKDFISFLVASKMMPDAPQWLHRGAGGGVVIHGLGAVICTEEIKENGMEPFCVNDIGLNVC